MTIATQLSFADIGEPLHQTTFVVVDLETTGSRQQGAGITEIGAVKTRGGEVIGEFQTLVDPGMPIPPMIVALTGITDAMVTAAPRIEAVLPAFLEFLGDSVLVAHNAPFDVGFLKAACHTHGYPWPGNEVVDTVLLARRATTKDEAPNKKLATLARVFGSPVTPNHRALEDARATSAVLHGMLERLARFGITHREDLSSLRHRIPDSLRAKAVLADTVPASPGVYVFRGPRGEQLYVGKSKNMRARVKSYFTNAEQRRSMRDMVSLATAVDSYAVPTDIEARVLEVRLIDQYRPRFNRRSMRPERTPWIKFTDERFPRLSVSRSASPDSVAIGPMRGTVATHQALHALQIAVGIRSCTTRLPITPKADARACLLKDLGQCQAPCVRGEASGYDQTTAAARAAMSHDLSPVVTALEANIGRYADKLEYERAAELRDGLAALVSGSARTQRLRAIQRCRIVATRRVDNAWEMLSVAYGRLMSTTKVAHGVWDSARALEEHWDDEPQETLVEETEMVLGWLEQPGTRLLMVDGEWSSPVTGAARHSAWISAQHQDQESVREFQPHQGT